MDTNDFKSLIKIGIGIIIILVLVVLTLPFLNTGIQASLSPENAILIYGGKEYSNPAKIKLRPGEYEAEVKAYGFKPKKFKFKVGVYGTTKTSFELRERYPDAIPGLPLYPDFSQGFMKVDATYGEMGELTYIINSFGVPKETAINWLKANGADLKDVKIEFIEDGD